MFPKLLEITPLEGFKLRLKYFDNTQGEIDLSYLVNEGVFRYWLISDNFFKAKIDGETGAIHWNESVELCPDSMYLKLIGKSFEEYRNELISNASN